MAMTFEEYAQKHLGTAGLSFEGIELVRMGWNARGTCGDANEAGVVGHEYSQGICGDGAAILKDGQPMTIEQIVQELQVAQERIKVQNEKLNTQPNHIADASKRVKGVVALAGDITDKDNYENALVITFADRAGLKAALDSKQCRFTVFGGEV
jgi:hypothetical protein